MDLTEQHLGLLELCKDYSFICSKNAAQKQKWLLQIKMETILKDTYVA